MRSVFIHHKEGRIFFLFNDALDTSYARLYGVRYMINNHSDSERGNPLQPHRLHFPISSKAFYMHHPIESITHTTTFVTPVVEHWLEWEIAQWVHPIKDPPHDSSCHYITLLPRSYISLLYIIKSEGLVSMFFVSEFRYKMNYSGKKTLGVSIHKSVNTRTII